jgi:hypothetical protein
MTNELLRDAAQWTAIGAGIAVYAIVKYRNGKKNGNSKKPPCEEHGNKITGLEANRLADMQRFEDFMKANSSEHALMLKILNGGRE